MLSAPLEGGPKAVHTVIARPEYSQKDQPIWAPSAGLQKVQDVFTIDFDNRRSEFR